MEMLLKDNFCRCYISCYVKQKKLIESKLYLYVINSLRIQQKMSLYKNEPQSTSSSTSFSLSMLNYNTNEIF